VETWNIRASSLKQDAKAQPCIACLRILRQISAKDAHNVQRDGLAFGKDKRNFDPVGAPVLDFSAFSFHHLVLE